MTATAVRTRSVYWRYHLPGYRVANASLDGAGGELVLL